jgi:broad specificity phosphatase PhoE
MAIRLTLISHAPTAATRSGAFPLDEPLDERGLALARQAATGMRVPNRALVSPTLRARQTAEALGIAATVDPLLSDCDFGCWAGRRLADVEKDEPDAVAAWIAEPGLAPHGGESIEGLLRRVATWLAAHACDSGHLVAITHPAVIRAAIVGTIGAGARSFWRIDIAPLTLTELRGGDERWTLRAAGVAMGARATIRADRQGLP